MKPEEIKLGRIYLGTGSLCYRQVREITEADDDLFVYWVPPAQYLQTLESRKRLSPGGRVRTLSGFAAWAQREINSVELEHWLESPAQAPVQPDDGQPV